MRRAKTVNNNEKTEAAWICHKMQQITTVACLPFWGLLWNFIKISVLYSQLLHTLGTPKLLRLHILEVPLNY